MNAILDDNYNGQVEIVFSAFLRMTIVIWIFL